MRLSATINRSSNKTIVLSGLSIVMISLFLISLSIGAVPISITQIISILFSKLGIGSSADDVQNLVLLNIRLPRVLFTLLIGASLGISGASLQGLFRNPLVEPGVIGVSSGAAVGAICVLMGGKILAPIFFSSFGVWLLPFFAFLGGIVATMITLRLGSYHGKTQITILILSGVAITGLAGAAIGLSIFYADEQQLRTYSFWTLGDLSTGTWEKVGMLAPFASIAIAGLLVFARPLNALALGEAEAFHSGVNVERVKTGVILLSALAVGTSVAFAGIIGFVGLVVPHVIRILFSPDNEIVLPASALGGACLLVLADMFARTIVAPSELPIGIVTAIVGTPFFMYLLIAAKRKKNTLMLEAHNITYRIGGRLVLNDCSVSIHPGTFTAIVGTNGAGKTSLLKVLSNEIQQYTGEVFLNRKPITQIAPQTLSCQRAVLPQHTAVNFPFTVEQIISVGRYPHHATQKKNAAAIDEAMERTALTALRGRIYHTLSGGEQQRVQMARVIAQLSSDLLFSKYLLLDEPTSSLDIAQQHAMLEMAKGMCRQDVGVVAILHDLNLAAQYADQILLLKEGKTIAQGPTIIVMTKDNIEETFSHPVHVTYDEWTNRPVIYPMNRNQQSINTSNFTVYNYEHNR